MNDVALELIPICREDVHHNKTRQTGGFCYTLSMITFGIIGLLIISGSLWIKNEVKQNILFICGGVSLLLYSIYIDDMVFIVLQCVFILSAGLELLKTLRS